MATMTTAGEGVLIITAMTGMAAMTVTAKVWRGRDRRLTR
jgi:hypothetical protein